MDDKVLRESVEVVVVSKKEMSIRDTLEELNTALSDEVIDINTKGRKKRERDRKG